MKHKIRNPFSLSVMVAVGMVAAMTLPVAAEAGTAASTATAGGTSTTTASTPSTANTKVNQQRLQDIINRGNSEITRRLTELSTLDSKISSATKLTSSDQSALLSEVNNETSGLTSLKASLDSATQVSSAITDAEAIFADYRVYLLVVPQVNLVKTADDQQVTETKLTALASKIQADITADQTAGKNVSTLQTELNTMTAKVQAAQTISSTIETSVLPLTPSDYNTNHSVMTGDRDQLKTAQNDIVAAITDAKNLVSGLKSL